MDNPEVIAKIDMPTDPAEIKEHMRVRRQAVRIMLADLSMLSERLRHTIGPIAWLEYMEQVKQAGEEDIATAYKMRQGENQ